LTPLQAADVFPSKPIRIIVPAAPGGTTDIAARALADRMSIELGQPIVVENRAGASGIIGVQAFLAATPDGYTILMGNIGPNAINYALYKNLSYKPEDMIPITTVISNPNVLVVNPAVPAKTVNELVTLAKASPGKISFASSGRGQSVHMSGELFKLKAGIDIVHVPYKGTGPALIDVLAGQVSMIFSSLPSTMGFIRGGRLRPLAVTGKQRAPELPDVPTMEEAVFRSPAGLACSHPPRPLPARSTRYIAPQRSFSHRLRSNHVLPNWVALPEASRRSNSKTM
jgi:tripartite-type tricarboxylate transporter receptor subunit TctC